MNENHPDPKVQRAFGNTINKKQIRVVTRCITK